MNIKTVIFILHFIFINFFFFPLLSNQLNTVCIQTITTKGARCSSVVRAFAHGAMGRRIDPSWSGPIELFLVAASAPRLV